MEKLVVDYCFFLSIFSRFLSFNSLSLFFLFLIIGFSCIEQAINCVQLNIILLMNKKTKENKKTRRRKNDIYINTYRLKVRIDVVAGVVSVVGILVIIAAVAAYLSLSIALVFVSY